MIMAQWTIQKFSENFLSEPRISKSDKKANTDNYYCCTADNVNELFNQWSEWGACEITRIPTLVGNNTNNDANTCGCVNDGEETCGRQIRKRDLKCPEVRFSRSGKS